MGAMDGKGGNWTEEKLTAVKKYLSAFNIALKNQHFHRVYIDGFAGSGHRKLPNLPLFDDLDNSNIAKFAKGSTRLALECDPGFDQYIFIEKSKSNFQYLEKLKSEFDDKKVLLFNCDANEKIKDLCKGWNSKKWRAVLFLDPYASEVEWSTLQYIANTEAIDVWILYPIMVANRMLPHSGEFGVGWKERLSSLFGTDDWETFFYSANEIQTDLFNQLDSEFERFVTWDRLEEYYYLRLKSIFKGGVSKKPLRLIGGKNQPIFSLFFCCSNPSPKAANIAMRISNNILKA